MESFRALRVHQVDGQIVPRLEQLTLDDLSPGDVVIRGDYSSINYKDALATTGKGRILRRFPLVAGVDIAGTVVSSGDARFKPGDLVAVHGCGLSETHDGGFAEYARVPGDWVNKLPAGIDARTAMGLGTAGFTAALAIHRLEQNGPDAGDGARSPSPGATGGVGSVAIALLAGLGFKVTAVTSKTTADDYLKGLGASDIFHLKGQDARHQAPGKGPLGRRRGQPGRRHAGLAHPHRRALRQHRQHRPGPGSGTQHHRDALHPPGREPARHQLRGGAAGRCAPRSGGGWPAT